MNKQELSDYVRENIDLTRTIIDEELLKNVSEDQHILNRLSHYYKVIEKNPENLLERASFIEKFKGYLMTPYQKAIDNLDKKIVKLDNQKEYDFAKGGFKVFWGTILTGAGVFGAFLSNPAFLMFAGSGGLYTLYSLYSTLTKHQKQVKKLWETIDLKNTYKFYKEQIEQIENSDLEEVLKDNKEYIEPLLYFRNE